MKTFLAFLLVVVALSFGSVQYSHAGPTDDLKPILDELTLVLKDENLKGKAHLVERREKIMINIKRCFDFREMSRRVLGKTWKKIDEVERQKFTVLMTKFLENVYIGKLESYSGDAIEYSAEIIKGKRAQVTTIINSAGVDVPVHYIMRKTETRWLVYDINIEGVSVVRNYHEQFKSIIRKDQYSGLVKVLEEKNLQFLEETE